MKKLFESAEKYLEASDWKDLAIIKFCLFSMGVLMGTYVKESEKKSVRILAGIVFIATYIPLMAKYFSVLMVKDDEE